VCPCSLSCVATGLKGRTGTASRSTPGAPHRPVRADGEPAETYRRRVRPAHCTQPCTLRCHR
jgi:hypothetical protein